MSEQTKIAWCDSTVNWWEGCTMVSAGCANCYAKTRDDRQLIEKVSHWGVGAPRRKSKSAVKDALAFNRKPWICDECSVAFSHPQIHECPTISNVAAFTDETNWHRRRIFSLSLGDWLDDEVPIEWLAEMLDTIRQCDQVTWILCTKRPENFLKRMADAAEYCADKSHNRIGGYDEKSPKNHWQDTQFWIEGWYEQNISPENIILLTSVENQAMADKRIPELLKIPAACRGLSLEPLLGPVTMNAFDIEEGIDWAIIGGESGPNARPCNVDWIRSLVNQSEAAGVATFVKQFGSFSTTDEATPDGWPVGADFMKSSCRRDSLVVLNDKKGGDPSEWPQNLRVQQWPKGF